jgi:hypothetical protein
MVTAATHRGLARGLTAPFAERPDIPVALVANHEGIAAKDAADRCLPMPWIRAPLACSQPRRASDRAGEANQSP